LSIDRQPALAASSPIVEGRRSGFADTRLDYYQRNQARVPSIIGSVIPEPVYTRADYEQQILQQTFRDIRPYDTGSVLQEEFLNSRGAIARFSRGSIEIRLLDIQECPAADMAIVEFIVALLKAHVAERFLPYEEQKQMPTEALRTIFLDCVRDGEKAIIHHTPFLRMFDLHEHHGVSARETWMTIADALHIDWRQPTSKFPLGAILQRGTLSTRILRAMGDPYDPDRIPAVYRELCTCLAEGRQFGL
ncbi:MAG TPA: glutamate-cysteine ligase family protein, partial [Salinarimonas sp.]|nr:glutamate-cysteine ligase family protein [Salinarimonas sp.]